ncbi:MAG: 3'-5' exonuclease, partial [Leptospirales bacterium]
ANFALLNQKGPSRNRKLKQFIIPLLQTTIDLENRGVSPPVAALRYLEAARRADLDPDTGFRTLSEEHWTKAGDNIAGVCPTLPRLVQALERLRAIDFGEASQALSADTILGVADDLEKYKRARARVSFNDMLRLVRAALVPEGSALLEILREQFQYAIVDEFQDTDPVQWEIFRRLYLDAGARGKLYLVGDPKQAIYGFRGADVFAYFQARETIENLARDSRAALYRLATNFRSVPELVRVFNDLFATPAFFGAPDPGPLAKASGGGGDVAALAIGYTPALESRPELRKIQVAADESGRAALQLVRLDQAGSGRAAKRAYFRFLAREIHALIRGKKIRLGVSDAAARPLDFGDVCILLRTRSDAPLMEDALERLNIPHSFYKKTGLYQTREALELSLVLRAVEAPARLEAGYKAGLTRFFRLSPEEIDDLRRRDQSPDEQGEPAFRVKINAWSELAEARRWPAFFRSLLQSSLALLPADTAPGGEGAPEAQREAVIEPQYERAVTNYEQICDELAEHAVRENFDLTGVIEYLELLRDEATPVREEWDVHRQESEDARVRLMTIHTAKGLEFPIVCVAGGFTRRMAHLYETFEYHNDQNQRVHDLLLADEKRFRREEEAEERRLYYVALTRAAMKLYLPYYRPTDARSKHTAGPLARFVRDAIDAAYRDPEDARDRLRFLETEEAGDFFQSDARPAGPGTATLPAVDLERSRGDEDRAPGDSARDFDPRILFPEEPAHANRRRRDLLSYTALSHGRSSSDPAAERTVGDSVPEAENAFLETSRDREDAAGLAFEFSSAVEVPAPSLSPTIQELDRRMRGADAGTMLHDMLEQLDYPGVAGDAAPLVLSDGNRRMIDRQLRRNGL